MNEKTTPPLIRYLTLFALIYLVLLFLAGLARIYLSFKSDLNIPILFVTSIIISYLLAKKSGRYLTKKEVIKFSLGACAIVLVIKLGAICFLTQNLALTTSWTFWLLLLIDLIFLFVFFVYFPNKFFKAIEANEKKTYDKKNIKKRRIVLTLLFVITALMLCDFFLSNFLPNSTYYKITFYIIVISTVASTAYLNRYLSLKLEDPEFQSNTNPSFKKAWVRISGFGLLTMLMSFALFGGTLPWLYTGIAGFEGDLLVKVTSWKTDSRCPGPYVNDQIFFSPSRGLCVDSADRSKYPKGTTLRLKGKISALGINVSQMEIVNDTQHFSP